MTYQNSLFEVQQGVARLTLNRPDQPNSFSAAMHEEVRAALELFKAAPSFLVHVLTGAGQDLLDQDPIDLEESIGKYHGTVGADATCAADTGDLCSQRRGSRRQPAAGQRYYSGHPILFTRP